MVVPITQDASVAVLVDCDNVPPDIVDHALLMGAQFGRVVLRRGYGNTGTLANRWQEVLVRQAFTPCLQYQYASKKNTADIALALDALEALFDRRAEVFCLVTSDSDFAYLCRKLRERGATVCIVGEPKTPDALRNACDQFFEWTPAPVESSGARSWMDEAPVAPVPQTGESTEPTRPQPRRRPRFIVEAVSLLTNDAADGEVHLSTLGAYLKRADSAFSPNAYGHSGLLNMLKTYDLLTLRQEGPHWRVSLSPQASAESGD